MTATQRKSYKNILINKLTELTAMIADKREAGMKDFEEVEADVYDVCTQAYSKEEFYSLCERDLQVLAMVKAAIKKANTQAFGLCEECEEPINEKRLKALPWVKYCIRCQSRIEEEVAA
jgi:DnaK suppressor protein